MEILTVYRTVKAKYVNDPLATEGARLFDGRWNPKGYPLLYTTSSPALALVESLVHQPRVKYEKLPELFLFTLEIQGVMSEIVTLYPLEQLPDYWNDASYERTEWILRDWLNKPTTLVVAVPSVVVPMSYNYLIHPAHPDFDTIRVVKYEAFPIGRRLWRESNFPPETNQEQQTTKSKQSVTLKAPAPASEYSRQCLPQSPANK